MTVFVLFKNSSTHPHPHTQPDGEVLLHIWTYTHTNSVSLTREVFMPHGDKVIPCYTWRMVCVRYSLHD
jgi:hypothetical protein